MVAHRHNVVLTPDFMEQARELSASNRAVASLLPKTLDKLVARPDDPSLHREPLKRSTVHLSSSRVNRKYRVIDREEDASRIFALFVGNHEDSYRYADRYSNLGQEEIGALWGDAVEALPARDIASASLASRLPCAARDEDSARFVPAASLMALGLSAEDAEHVRRSAWNDIDFAGYFGEELADSIETLLAESAPSTPRPENVPLPLPRLTASAPVTLTAPGQFAAMLEMGLDRYLTTLTDDQRALAEIRQPGLLVIKGVGGSGKTTVAAYRVKTLADRIQRQPALLQSGPRRVLYLCFNKPLADTVERVLLTLYGAVIPPIVQVRTLHSWMLSYLSEHAGERVDMQALSRAVERACRTERARILSSPALRALASDYVMDEIAYVILGRGLETHDQYLAADRAGRGQALSPADRDVIWSIYQCARQDCERQGVLPVEMAPARAMAYLEHDSRFISYEAVVLDEAQDLTPVQLRLAQRLVGGDLSRLTVFADAAQSIYRCGFRWKLAELTPRGGQVRTLNRNHRNTAPIQRLALNFLEQGVMPDEADTYIPQLASDRQGPRPELLAFTSTAREIEGVCAGIAEQITEGRVPPQNIAVLAGFKSHLELIEQGLRAWGIACDNASGASARPLRRGRAQKFSAFHPGVKLLTMHGAKGLDFPHVYIVDLTTSGLPLDRIRDAESYAIQRRLLYTAMIRAGLTLTISTVRGHSHRLIQELDPALYDYHEITDPAE